MVDWYFEILDVLGVISLNDDRCIREHAQDYLESIAGLNYQGAQMEARLDGLPPPPSTQMIEESDVEKQWAFTATKAPAESSLLTFPRMSALSLRHANLDKDFVLVNRLDVLVWCIQTSLFRATTNLLTSPGSLRRAGLDV